MSPNRASLGWYEELQLPTVSVPRRTHPIYKGHALGLCVDISPTIETESEKDRISFNLS